MNHIRPWQLFEHLKENREVLYRIPSHKAAESETIMSLETMLLIAAARIVDARSILEIGTGLGYNALQMARNLPARIVTVDKDKKDFAFSSQPELDITSIQKDVFDLTPSPFDFVFCDINYTLGTVTMATEIAFRCNPKLIAWHDYGYPPEPHTISFLNELSQSRELFHVEDSWMVFWFKEKLKW